MRAIISLPVNAKKKIIFEQDWATVEVMHITVSFKDHSSICTCMLLKKKKKSWMIEQKQGHHHKQTNSRPMRGEEVTVYDRGDGSDRRVFLLLFFFSPLLTWNGAVRNWCVEQLSSTPNMAVHRRLSQVNVMLSVNEGLHFFQQNQTQIRDLKFSALHVQITDQCRDCAAALHDMFFFLFCISYQTCQPWTF